MRRTTHPFLTSVILTLARTRGGSHAQKRPTRDQPGRAFTFSSQVPRSSSPFSHCIRQREAWSHS
jgi:hypothetical protein